jgi:hypothetical protein
MFGDNQNKMDKEKVKLIVRNMELLLDALKVELYGKSEYHSIDDVEYEEDYIEGQY